MTADTEYMAGRWMSRYKADFQHFYGVMQNTQMLIRLCDDLISWPRHPKTGIVSRPPDDRLVDWCYEVEEEAVKLDEKKLAKAEKRLQKYVEYRLKLMVLANVDAAEHLARLAKDGQLDADKQVQIKYLADAIGFVTRETAAAFQQKTQQITAGNFSLNILTAGPKRPRRLPPQKKQLAAPVIDGEYAVVA